MRGGPKPTSSRWEKTDPVELGLPLGIHGVSIRAGFKSFEPPLAKLHYGSLLGDIWVPRPPETGWLASPEPLSNQDQVREHTLKGKNGDLPRLTYLSRGRKGPRK